MRSPQPLRPTSVVVISVASWMAVRPMTVRPFSSSMLVRAIGVGRAAKKRPRAASEIRNSSPWTGAPCPGFVLISPGVGGVVSRARRRYASLVLIWST